MYVVCFYLFICRIYPFVMGFGGEMKACSAVFGASDSTHTSYSSVACCRRETFHGKHCAHNSVPGLIPRLRQEIFVPIYTNHPAAVASTQQFRCVWIISFFLRKNSGGGDESKGMPPFLNKCILIYIKRSEKISFVLYSRVLFTLALRLARCVVPATAARVFAEL